MELGGEIKQKPLERAVIFLFHKRKLIYDIITLTEYKTRLKRKMGGNNGH